MHGYHHPNLLRAVYIDAHHYRPDFLTHLVSFALNLRNAGLSDQGLLLYLSEFIAGSLMNDSSHSTIYDEDKVFKMAIEWGRGGGGDAATVFSFHPLAESFQQAPYRVRPFGSASYEPFTVPRVPNHYYLPWIVHSLWTDPDLRQHPFFSAELMNLQELYARWTPTTKILKDLKWKLEPISLFQQSKL